MGSTGLLLVGGFFENITLGYREQFIHSQTGHLQVGKEGYFQKGASAPFDYLLKDVQQVQETIENQPHVLYTVPRLKFSGMASSDKTGISVLALGVDPAREHRMGEHKAGNSHVKSTQIIEGNDLDSSDPYGAVLGKGLMNALGLKIGDPFNFITTREAGAIDGMEFKVRGAFETIMKDFDDRGMKVPLSTAQKLLGIENNAHSLLILIDDSRNQEEVQQGLVRTFKAKNLGLEVIPWQAQGLFYRQSKALLEKIYSTVLFIMCIIFFFSIANTINMAVLERTREFGTMMAIGNSRVTIFLLIFLEASFLGLVGSLLGLLIGALMAKIVSMLGIEMPPPPNGSSSYIAMITITPPLLLKIGCLAFVSTIFASLIPGYRACHFKITNALGYV
jgi:putative ABC transport system permease protein